MAGRAWLGGTRGTRGRGFTSSVDVVDVTPLFDMVTTRDTAVTRRFTAVKMDLTAAPASFAVVETRFTTVTRRSTLAKRHFTAMT
jgi:hypothetical protein